MICEVKKQMEIVFSSGDCQPREERQPVVRSEKGNSLLQLVSDYVVIDSETTGLDVKWDRIIELAGIKFRAGQEVGRFESLINPGFEIDEFIAELTGITNDKLQQARPQDEVLPEFLSFVGDDVLVGHNVSFDVNYITFVGHEFLDSIRESKQWATIKKVLSKVGAFSAQLVIETAKIIAADRISRIVGTL